MLKRVRDFLSRVGVRLNPYALPLAVNAVLWAAIFFYSAKQVDSGGLADDPLTWPQNAGLAGLSLYAAAVVALLYGGLVLVVDKLIRSFFRSAFLRYRLPSVLFALASGTLLFLFTIDAVFVFVFRCHLQLGMFSMLFEPGLMVDLNLTPRDLVLIAVSWCVVTGLEYGLVRWNRVRVLATDGDTASVSGLRVALFSLAVGLLSPAFALPLGSGGPVAAHALSGVPSLIPELWDSGSAAMAEALGRKKAKKGKSRKLPRSYEYLGFATDQQRRSDFSGIRAQRDWNVMFIVSECWRSDVLDPAVTPTLTRLQKDGAVALPNAFSTGNATILGMFGLVSGQYANFWRVLQDRKAGSDFLRLLKALGYTTTTWSGATSGGESFDWMGMNRFLFNVGVDAHRGFSEATDKRTNESIKLLLAERDRRMVDGIVHELTAGGSEKRFDLVYFNATHYPFSCPPAYESFNPVDARLAAGEDPIPKRGADLHLRYLRAVHFIDHEIGRLIEALQRSGRLKNTFVVITGDHGQEFFERGHFGHNTALNRFQTQVPLLILSPEPFSTRYSVASLADVAPTVADLLRLNMDVSDRFSGKSLAGYDPQRDGVVLRSMFGGGASEYAVIYNGKKDFIKNEPTRVTVARAADMSDHSVAPDHREAAAYMMRVKRYFLHRRKR